MNAIARKEPRAPREYVDFSKVPPSQWAMHDRLDNWGRWCNSRQAQEVSAGFSLHKSDEWDRREYGAETVVPVDKEDAVRVHVGLSNPSFPDKHRRALQWCYVRPRSPSSMARELGLSLGGLAEIISDARLMLINRQV